MNVSITGGSGFIGKLLMAGLVSRGDNVTALSRRSGLSERDVKFIKADLASAGGALDEFVHHADVIFHCAGEVNNKTLMYGLHVDGTKHLLRAVHDEIKRSGRPIHWVQLSSTGAYGARKGQADQELVIDESFRPAPVGDYEISKTISDELVLGLATIEPLFTCTIIRPSIVVGPDMTNTSFFQMAHMVRKRIFFYIGRRSSRATYVHVDDVVRALMTCSIDPRAVGETFILSNDCLLEDVIQRMAECQGVRAPRLRIPEGAIRTLTRVLSTVVRLPLTPERIDALTKCTGYSSAHIKEVLDFNFECSVPDCIPMMIAYRAARAS